MATKKVYVAICYDFDGTLAPGNMQEYGFMDALQIDDPKKFWEKSNGLARQHKADLNLAYMKYMIEMSQQSAVKCTDESLKKYGKSVTLFDGVEDWFGRINKYASERGITLEHYIVSSGLREMIMGTKIGRKFKKIYACTFMYDHNGVPFWPAVVVNFTTKTQFLFRINKGIEDDNDTAGVNKNIPESERRIPFSRMIYIGDGATDIPCMKLVKDKGGTSIAVYDPSKRKKRKESASLVSDSRVNYEARADYSDKKQIDMIVKAVIDKIVAEAHLQKYLPKQTLSRKKEPASRREVKEDAQQEIDGTEESSVIQP